jgi:hypothetical protein
MRPISTIYKRAAVAVGALALFGSGVGIGAAISHSRRPTAIMAATAATPIARLADPSLFFDAEAVTITGKIVERSAGRIVLQDGSGKTAVVLREPGSLAGQLAVGTTVSVQGRVGAGVFKPSFVVLPGNRVIALRRHEGGSGSGSGGGGGGRHRRHDRGEDKLVFLGRMTVVATPLPADSVVS